MALEPVSEARCFDGLQRTYEHASAATGTPMRVTGGARIALVAPDTSPRGEGVPDDASWDFGQDVGSYLDAGVLGQELFHV